MNTRSIPINQLWILSARLHEKSRGVSFYQNSTLNRVLDRVNITLNRALWERNQ